MNIPALPTDSLYKFAALSGLAIALFSVAFASSRTLELELRVAESRTESEILNLEASALAKALEPSQQGGSTAPDRLAMLQSRELELSIKRARLEGRNEQTKILVRDLRFWFYFLWVGSFLGAFISGFGFVLWYRRVQEPSDVLLQNQVQKRDA